MYDKGYKNFDDVSIKTHLANKKNLLDGYMSRGGYTTIHKALKVIDGENSDVYFDELSKNNMIIDYYNKLDFTKLMEKFNQMTCEQVFDYFEYQLNDSALNKTTDINIEDLTITDDFLMSLDKGEDVGLNYGEIAKILNYLTIGIPKGDLTLVGAHSGKGKTSWSFAVVVLTILRQGHKVCVISNEQKSKEFKRLLIAMTLAERFGYYNLNRKHLKIGGFDATQWANLKKAQKIINEEYGGKIKFIKMFDYNTKKVCKTIKKLSKKGFELFMYDTMKAENAADSKVHGELVENSKELFQTVNKCDVAMIISYQLAGYTLNQRYLDETCLSNSKQIKEVFSEMLFFRELWQDEYDDGKYFVAPYTFKKIDGKYEKVPVKANKETGLVLNPDKKYCVFFLNKTRNDDTGHTILYRFDSAWNRWTEIGYCTIKHDREVRMR